MKKNHEILHENSILIEKNNEISRINDDLPVSFGLKTELITEPVKTGVH